MYLKRLITVVVCTFLAAYVIGFTFDKLYKKRWSVVFFNKADELINKDHDYEIIILGNSRAHFGINPYYIDSITGMNSYNFGNGGADIRDIKLTAGVYMQQHPPPKTAVLSIDESVFAKYESISTRFHYLYYLQNDSINTYMRQAGFKTSLIKIFPPLRYSFFDEYNRTSIFIKGKKYPRFGHNIFKGFLNFHKDRNSKNEDGGKFNEIETSDQIWDTAITYLNEVIDLFERHGTRVVIVKPPLRKNADILNSIFKHSADSILNTLVAKRNLVYFDLENDALLTTQDFVDDIHLNEPGTKIYSAQLGKLLHTIITKPGSTLY